MTDWLSPVPSLEGKVPGRGLGSYLEITAYPSPDSSDHSPEPFRRGHSHSVAPLRFRTHGQETGPYDPLTPSYDGRDSDRDYFRSPGKTQPLM